MAWFWAESKSNAVLLFFRKDIIRQKAFPRSFGCSFKHKTPILSLISYAEMLANHNRGHLGYILAVFQISKMSGHHRHSPNAKAVPNDIQYNYAVF